MMINILIIIACCIAYYVSAHPHCHYDLREVDLEREMSYCSMDYAADGVCCTELEEAEIEETFASASDGLTTECAEYYKELLCGVCGSYSGHLYDLLANELGTEDGLTMTSEFCTGLTSACDGQIDFSDYDGVDYCTMHTGGGDDLWWSYPYESSGIFNSNFTELFPDLSESDRPGITLAMHQSPNGSMYWMAGQEGMLLGVDVDSLSSSYTVMDLSGDIFYDSYEEGLLDFAFSPMFDTNGFFYVSWTVNDTYARNRLSKFRYCAGDSNATRDSEEILLESSERSTFMHNGGWLGFKPSDYGFNDDEKQDDHHRRHRTRRKKARADYHDLYWALGDAGPQEDTENHAQRTDVLFGSMIRISVPSEGMGYRVPCGNYPDAELPEICAIGFRNIWRCGFDSLTDELYCGDVGHNNIESIYTIECGNNYGWVRFEGSRCTEYSEDAYGSCADADRSGYSFPIFEYCHYDFNSSVSSQDDYTGGNDICGDRSVTGTSIIGGYVYRGQAYADLIYGAYIFGDFTSRNIFYILQQDDGTWTSGTIVSDESIGVISFAEDVDGELFIIDQNNDIYYLPCGDLCEDDINTTTIDAYSSSFEAYGYIGCYASDSSGASSGNENYIHLEMTTELCAELCEGYTYFGTQGSCQCFCGEATDDPATLGSATCNLACSGDPTQFCGGHSALSIYKFTS